MQIKLSEHFGVGKLLRFTLPSIIMMIFTSVYVVVDGFFVSNYAGKTQFAAVNLIMPFLMILGCVGFMFGTGGSALIAKMLGQGKNEKANSTFSLIVASSALIGVVFGILGIIFIRPVAIFMKADGELLEYCVTYGRIILAALPFYILQYEFQCIFSTADKPNLGLYVTVAAGVSNMILDALFTAVFPFGIVGAAVATAVSQFVGGFVPLVYFSRKNTSLLRFTRFSFDGKSLLKACTNGSSEFMSNVSMSLVSMLYNFRLMEYAGEDGISAYGILMYVSFIFQSFFIGYSIGTASIVGYNFGAKNKKELHSVLMKSLMIVGICALVMFSAGEILASPLSKIFAKDHAELLEMTVYAFRFFSFSFLFSGFSIFGSSFFTALSDGLTSALISFFRTLVFQVAAVIIFPIFWELDGVWLSIVAAELASIIVTGAFLSAKRKKYGY